MLTKIIVIKFILILIMMIFERKKPKSVIFWFFIILLIPLGFILYLILGNRLKLKARKDIVKNTKNTKNYLKSCLWYGEYLKNSKNNCNKLITWLKNKFNIDLWQNNAIKIFNNGSMFLDDLLRCISSAKKYVFLEFYIFADDEIGMSVSKKLQEKTLEGVRVKIVYDAIGSRGTSGKFWNDMKNNGVEVFPYFPSFLNAGILNMKINYRNHRKIVVIDGKIAYVGGINLREDHIGKDKRLKPWNDVMVKIKGNAVYPILNTFLNDYKYASGNQISKNQIQDIFPKPTKKVGVGINVLSCGPESDETKIKCFYEKVIKSSKEFLYIQTPYFVVDDKIIKLLIKAKQRGVDVKIFLPSVPDKKIVYACSLKCLKPLLQFGVEVYLDKGFLHAKTLLTEDCLIVGSCNFDNRSFELNFETVVSIYDKTQIARFKTMLINDCNCGDLLNEKKYKKLAIRYSVPWIIYKIISKLL